MMSCLNLYSIREGAKVGVFVKKHFRSIACGDKLYSTKPRIGLVAFREEHCSLLP
jgi:hypothetical protein